MVLVPHSAVLHWNIQVLGRDISERFLLGSWQGCERFLLGSWQWSIWKLIQFAISVDSGKHISNLCSRAIVYFIKPCRVRHHKLFSPQGPWEGCGSTLTTGGTPLAWRLAACEQGRQCFVCVVPQIQGWTHTVGEVGDKYYINVTLLISCSIFFFLLSLKKYCRHFIRPPTQLTVNRTLPAVCTGYNSKQVYTKASLQVRRSGVGSLSSPVQGGCLAIFWGSTSWLWVASPAKSERHREGTNGRQCTVCAAKPRS